MKKRIFSLLAALLLSASLFAALALNAAADSERQLPLVCDAYGLLTEEEDEALNKSADTYSAMYECDIIVVVVPDTEGYNVEDYAEAVYQYYDYGWGAEKSGVILLLSMEDRDYDLAAYGYGNTAFTDYGKAWLMDDVLPFLGDDDWYGGFRTYIDLCADYLRQAREGRPVDYYGGSETRARPRGFYVTAPMVLVSLIVGLIPAGITVLVMRSKMKSAVLQTRADSYLDSELQLTERSDRFINKTTTRVRRSDDSGSRSGGGHGTSVRSSGFSHHSGKF